MGGAQVSHTTEANPSWSFLGLVLDRETLRDRVIVDVVPIGKDQAMVEGRTHVDDLNKALDLDVPEGEEYETVGGLLFTMIGRVPEKGEQFDLDGVRFTILDADERRINRVKVTKVG